MDLGIEGLLGFSAIAVLVGTFVMWAMVRYDLGPRAGLAGGRQWLLGMALGTGVAAFLVKLVLILTMPVVAPAPTQPEIPVPRAATPAPPPGYVWVRLPERRVDTAQTPPIATQHTWEALPEQAPAPPENPTTAEKVALGERLFFDPRLSQNGEVSCSSCHDVNGGSGADGRRASVGIGGQVGKRNAPTVWNAAFQSLLFWDGRAASLEEQAVGPLINPVEMGMASLAAVEQQVAQDLVYRTMFARAFGADAPITIERIAAAIAAYERTLITPDTPYDRFVRGDLNALSPAQLRGMALFGSLGCANCHSGPNFSTASLFDPSSPRRLFPVTPTPYEVRYHLTDDLGDAGSDRGVWRVPSLRNVALTAPYFHNGSVDDLREAVRIMASVQLGRTGHLLMWSNRDKVLTEFDTPSLGDQEVDDIVAFLHALTSESLLSRVERGKRIAAKQNQVTITPK